MVKNTESEQQAQLMLIIFCSKPHLDHEGLLMQPRFSDVMFMLHNMKGALQEGL